MKKKSFWKRVRKRLLKLRLQPVRVFCFHQVSDEFEPDTMWECDWTQTDVFKRKILALKEEYTFVSLTEAYRHIANDKIRFRKYAALTADDGWASLKNIIPWLAEQQVPVTLFLNPCYLDGKHFREREREKFLLTDDLIRICEEYTTVSFGMHGWEHIDASTQSEDAFITNVEQSIHVLRVYKPFVPFFAFTWGRYNRMNISVLERFKVLPVLMDGNANFGDNRYVHRELLIYESNE